MGNRHILSKPFMWTVIGSAALLCAHSVFSLVREHQRADWKVLPLVVVTIATGRFLMIKIPRGNGEISIVDSLIFLTLLLYGGDVAILLATVESLYSCGRFNSKPITILMAGATMACSTFITFKAIEFCFGSVTIIAHSASPQVFIGAVCVMSLAHYGANTAIVAIAVALKNGREIWQTWTKYYLWASITYFAGGIAAAVTVKLIIGFGFYGVVVIAPIITSVYFTYRIYLRNIEVSTLQAEQAEAHVTAQARYITELQQVDLALKKSEQHYRGLFENAHDAIIILSPENETVLDVNERACEMYGLSREAFVGISMLTLTKDTAPSESHLKQVILKGSRYQFETVQFRHDGTEMFLDINASVIEYKDQLAILSINRDVTERRALEEQLRQAQKMESIGTLAGGIAHDFNNLMTVVTGYSVMLLQDLEESNPIREDIVEIKNASDRAASLTRQLLAFSRKQVLQPKVLDLNEVVRDVSKMLKRLIGEHIELRIELEPLIWQVEVDPGQIEQVLMNLAVNARDAMPRGGALTISSCNLELTDTQCRSMGISAGKYVLLNAADTGFGMSEETIARIFEPFFTTKEVGKGTGLGLSTVHGIVKQSGGDLEVFSRPGIGSEFRIYLPPAMVRSGRSPATEFDAEGNEYAEENRVAG